MTAADMVVVKVGTRVLTHADGTLDDDRVASISGQLARLWQAGRRVVLVSSGAVGAGLGRLGLERRPSGVAQLQAVCLPDPLLGELRELARELGLAVLVEAHDERELERAVDVAPDGIGVNARDLKTFEVDLANVERLLPRVPASIVRVAESGVRGIDELLRVRAAGAHAVLVGEALMRAGSPEETLRAWREALDE